MSNGKKVSQEEKKISDSSQEEKKVSGSNQESKASVARPHPHPHPIVVPETGYRCRHCHQRVKGVNCPCLICAQLKFTPWRVMDCAYFGKTTPVLLYFCSPNCWIEHRDFDHAKIPWSTVAPWYSQFDLPDHKYQKLKQKYMADKSKQSIYDDVATTFN